MNVYRSFVVVRHLSAWGLAAASHLLNHHPPTLPCRSGGGRADRGRRAGRITGLPLTGHRANIAYPLRTCTFAPLRLEFDKARSKGTLFDGHGALKLGTHCRSGQQEIILREHAIYRTFNLLTPRSFRSRLAKVTYLDAATGKLVAEEAGLFIEDDADVAKRLEGKIVTVDKPLFVTIDPGSLNLMMLFEYMIGNTDFSIMEQHNVRVVQTPTGQRFVVPYDFDYSGLANADYAAPSKALPIATVRERLFRGPCRNAAEWQPYVDQLRAVKPKILELFDSRELSPKYRQDARSYLEQFYRTLDQPLTFKRAIIDPCAKVRM